jgi:hypothetical protein
VRHDGGRTRHHGPRWQPLALSDTVGGFAAITHQVPIPSTIVTMFAAKRMTLYIVR